jgi:hypothetical protein
MFEENVFHVGDIVEPVTPVKHMQLGKGIVVGTNDSLLKPIIVVFPPKGGKFMVHTFKVKNVELTTTTTEELKRIEDAEYIYIEMQMDIKKA